MIKRKNPPNVEICFIENISKVVGSIYNNNIQIGAYELSPFTFAVGLIIFILFITIFPLLIKYLPDKQSEKVRRSLPEVLIGLIILYVLIAVIFDR